MSAPACDCCGGAARGICYRCRARVATRRCACACTCEPFFTEPLLPPSPAKRLGAVTLLQPWATCCIPGPKGTENRTWELPLEPGGRWIGMHASLRFDSGVVDDRMVLDHLRRLWPTMPELRAMPVGAMLGVVHVVRCDRIDAVEELDEWASGPVGWRIDYRIALPAPVLCKGAQGIWFPAPPVAQKLWALFPRPLDPPPPQPDAGSSPVRKPAPVVCERCGETDGHVATCEAIPHDGPFHRARFER